MVGLKLVVKMEYKQDEFGARVNALGWLKFGTLNAADGKPFAILATQVLQFHQEEWNGSVTIAILAGQELQFKQEGSAVDAAERLKADKAHKNDIISENLDDRLAHASRHGNKQYRST